MVIIAPGQVGLSGRNYQSAGRSSINPTGGTGWTAAPPLPPGAIELYVANGGTNQTPGAVGGSDPTAGTITNPLATIGYALPYIRDLVGDRIWLRRTDAFTEGVGLHKSGNSASRPMILGAYEDTGAGQTVADARPILFHNNSTGSAVGIGHTGGGNPPGNHIWVKDLEIRPTDLVLPNTTNGDRVGIQMPSSNLDVLIEGCYIHGFMDNIVLIPQGRAVDVRVRRSVIADAWATSAGTPSKGLYAWGTDGLILDQCVFDHNGWRPGWVSGNGAPNQFSHNVYIAYSESPSTGMKVWNSMFSEGSAQGLQLRSGAEVERCVFARNEIGINLKRTGHAIGNVVLDGRNGGTAQGGHGIEVNGADGVQIISNVVAHVGSPAGQQIAYWSNDDSPPWGDGVNRNCTWANNRSYNWPGSTFDPGVNCYFDGPPPNTWSPGGPTVFPFPARDVPAYAQNIPLPGGVYTHATMVAAMRTLRRGAWIEAYTPIAMRNWIAAGYDL